MNHHHDTITDLCAALGEVYAGLKDKSLDARTAAEMTNALGKIVKGRTAQLEYFNLRKDKPEIAFWNEPEAGSQRAAHQ